MLLLLFDAPGNKFRNSVMGEHDVGVEYLKPSTNDSEIGSDMLHTIPEVMQQLRPMISVATTTSEATMI